VIDLRELFVGEHQPDLLARAARRDGPVAAEPDLSAFCPTPAAHDFVIRESFQQYVWWMPAWAKAFRPTIALLDWTGSW
jgi:hypothetical protein